MGANCPVADATPAGPAIRVPTADDLTKIAEIERASFADPWSRQSFATLLGNANVFFRVASLDRPGTALPSGVAGYVIAWFVVDEAEIANLAVEPGGRRRGIGSLLLDTAIGAADARGISAMFLEVRESNESARSLYASRGFREVGRRRAYYTSPREDALVLRRQLVEAGARTGVEHEQRK